jgi:hypothetical protein
MTKGGFLGFLFTRGDTTWGDWRQQQDIDELQLRSQLASSSLEATDKTVAALRATVAAQARELARMQLALQVLSNALVERAILDEDDLDARLTAATAAFEAANPAPKQSVVCSNCGLSYAAASMDGDRCKRCRSL